MMKVRMLVLLDILHELTDEEHILNSKELLTELEKRGHTSDRRSVYRDIEALAEYGFDVVLPVYDSDTICYTFTADGQDFCPENITDDVTVTVSGALIRNTHHTVTFVGMSGEVLSVQSVQHGQAATAPAAPEIEGYTFVGWDRDNFDCVTYAMTRTAIYEPCGPEPQIVPGDLDGDGIVTFTDIASLYLFLIGDGDIDEALLQNADFNGDGAATYADITDMYISLIS